MIKNFFLFLLLLIVLFTLMGCLSLRIENDVNYPAQLFKQTLKKIEKIHSLKSSRKKEISGIHFLIYNGEERKLVSFSISKSMIEFGLDHACREGNNTYKKHADKYVEINWDKVKDLNQLCPGLIIEVEHVEESTHVLIWAD